MLLENEYYFHAISNQNNLAETAFYPDHNSTVPQCPESHVLTHEPNIDSRAENIQIQIQNMNSNLISIYPQSGKMSMETDKLKGR